MTKREQASASTADLLVVNTLSSRESTMTTVLLPSNDPRGPRAVAIATDAGQWLRCRTRDGRKAYGIRSSANSDQVYLTTRTTCTCYDARRHECKHQLAVRLHVALVTGQ